jgi:hypothetical protein
MKTPKTLLLAAGFTVVFFAQAMVQSRSVIPAITAKETFPAQQDGPATCRTRLNVAMKTAEGPYERRSEATDRTLVLTTTLARPLGGLSTRLNAGLQGVSALQDPGLGSVGRPQFNMWCYVQCLQMGIDAQQCMYMCNGLPKKQ